MKRLLVFLVGVTLVACQKKESLLEPVRPVLWVEARMLGEQNLGRFAGTIQARYESNVGFRVAGRITSRIVDVGTEVEKGALLASLDPTDQRNQLRSAQADLASVKAQLIDAQATARRQEDLFNRGVGAQAQIDAASTHLKTTQASLDQSQSAVNQAKDQLNRIELRADYKAVVTTWNAEAGQVVTAGQQVVTLAQPNTLEAVIDLPDTLINQLPPDLSFLVSAQLDPNTVTTAFVREIAPQAENSTRTRRMRLSLANTPPGFRIGTAISVTVSALVKPHIELPVSALQEVEGKNRIWVIDPQTQSVSPREVRLISRTDSFVVLADGVGAGERIVSAGVNSLRPGQKVKVGEDDAE